ncbi:MAG: hypothetical protein R2744_13665 [Bacteroidales bacterium]
MIREDIVNPSILYLGTDGGVFVSKDGGKSWNILGDLPFAYVHDLTIHPGDNMIIELYNHGRGI